MYEADASRRYIVGVDLIHYYFFSYPYQKANLADWSRELDLSIVLHEWWVVRILLLVHFM